MNSGTAKGYIRPMPATWWLQRAPYLLFMLREFSCVFVGGYAFWFLVLLKRLSEGPQAYAAFLEGLRSPLAILLHVVALAFSLLHTITWFQATPRAMAIRRGEERVPDSMIILPNYLVWVVASALLAWIVWKS
ncbi:MAG: fumarate reductase subunit C [Acidobacteria bacterium]|nr:fumarate reductase subunit C [Acidobacteriota bacterium]